MYSIPPRLPVSLLLASRDICQLPVQCAVTLARASVGTMLAGGSKYCWGNATKANWYRQSLGPSWDQTGQMGEA